MAYKPSKRRRSAVSSQELNLVPIMNIIVIIIPFLLMTAVFAKTAILNIYLPQENPDENQVSQQKEPPKLLMIKVTEKGFLLGGIGKDVMIQKKNKHDFDRLTRELEKIKEAHPGHDEAALLFDKGASYDLVVKVMDATREKIDRDTKKKTDLFPFISLGENK